MKDRETEALRSIWKAFMSKQEMRKRLAGLSFSEKVRILEKLRDRSLALAASGMRQKVVTGSKPQTSKDEERNRGEDD